MSRGCVLVRLRPPPGAFRRVQGHLRPAAQTPEHQMLLVTARPPTSFLASWRDLCCLLTKPFSISEFSALIKTRPYDIERALEKQIPLLNSQATNGTTAQALRGCHNRYVHQGAGIDGTSQNLPSLVSTAQRQVPALQPGRGGPACIIRRAIVSLVHWESSL